MRHFIAGMTVLLLAGLLGGQAAANHIDGGSWCHKNGPCDVVEPQEGEQQYRPAIGPVRWRWEKSYRWCRESLGLEPQYVDKAYQQMRRCWVHHGRVKEWPWGKLAGCESGRRWKYNGRSGFDGGLQFLPRTWRVFKPEGYPRFAYLATPKMQVHVAKRVLRRQGKRAWPVCSRRIGWR